MRLPVFVICIFIILPSLIEGQLIDFLQRVFGGAGGGLGGLGGLGRNSPIFTGGFRLGGGGLPLLGIVSARLFNPLGGAFYRPLSGVGFGPLAGLRGNLGQGPGIRGTFAGIPFGLRAVGLQQNGIGQAIPYPVAAAGAKTAKAKAAG